MKYVERIHSQHTPAQLFDLVADVEQYPNYVPWVVSARVVRRKDNTMWTDMTMGAGFVRKQFTTVAWLERPRRMEIVSHDPVFEKFEQIWTFDPAADGGTDVECQLELSVRSHLLQVVIGVSAGENTKAMVRAYVRRAQRVYGPPRRLSANNQFQSGLSEP
jgi:coenzyme Q-binding protein COQ10